MELLSENVKVEILGTAIKTGSQDFLKCVFKSTYCLAETRFTVYFCSCQSPLRKALVLDMDSVLQKVDRSLWSTQRLMWRVTWKHRFPLTTKVFRNVRLLEVFQDFICLSGQNLRFYNQMCLCNWKSSATDFYSCLVVYVHTWGTEVTYLYCDIFTN